jgi:hypothetical protein
MTTLNDEDIDKDYHDDSNTRDDTCYDPMDVEKGVWSSPPIGGYVSGTSATLTCDPGFTVVPNTNQTIKCNKELLWDFTGDFPRCIPNETMIPLDEAEAPLDWISPTRLLESPCRYSTNLLSFYMTELNGLSVIIKIILLWICFNKYRKNKIRNNYVLFLLIILVLHVLVHLLIIIASLPPACDSSNFGWIPGKYFNTKLCHFKYDVYYSNYFWFLDIVLPNILLVIVIYYMKKL